ncbi:MAG: cytochrome c biogenesis protein CcsA [Gammaproteobacteria bacterium]|nr:cytochrome c biogenesis protein CcsA [Gammaproteobacteria bacterium]
MVTLFAIIAILLYLASSFVQYQATRHPQSKSRKQVLSLGSLAVVFHGLAWFTPLINHTMDLSFFHVGSLISLVISAIILISALRKPLETLFLGVFPMAAIIMACNLAFGALAQPVKITDSGLMSHIILSIMAYSVLSIAAFQAVLLIFQDRQLKHKHMSGIMRVLPPLQTMDRLLFDMIGMGMFLLTLAIVSGFLFLEDLFAQHLVHKTAFTLMAWSVYGALLLGHWRFGWRGTVASKWTLVGTGLLIAAYFGSKLVLEIILKR